MKILNADFITSADSLKNCPEIGLPEIALVGRSNVGKSSFINKICNRKNLAKTSNTPGKTRLINYYKINNDFVITDLPGYGFAKISKAEQQRWKKILEEYLTKRDTLKGVIQFIDARHDVQNNDFIMRDWLEYNAIPVITIAAKVDTLSKNLAVSSVSNISKKLSSKVIGFSGKTGYGTDEILDTLENFIKV